MDDLLLKIYDFYFKENKILHAYLFIVDDYDLAIDFLIKLSLQNHSYSATTIFCNDRETVSLIRFY